MTLTAEKPVVESKATVNNNNPLAKLLTVQELLDKHKQYIGDHFFDKEAMAFFKSDVERAYYIPQTTQAFFVTSEKSPTGNIGFTVRTFDGRNKSKGVVTLTPFNELTKKDALIALQEYIKKACVGL